MDNSSVSWAPKPALVAVGWLAAAVALAGTLLYEDRLGDVLFGIATVVLVLLSLHGMLVRPRLVADEHGVRVRTLSGAHELPWAGTHVALRQTRRLTRDSTTLEVSAGEQLFVFGWVELGADPRDVHDELARLQG
ncbi:PH domain-containing protein [Amycolatopsis acidicola]|uniref:PH domain-containing protein n=1 Tax=Amycolatopsis acidicola TaxID=2596893 RepID=A0A5N0VK16_9PSEU|nr:PH domain-containing protein [Amycolatopsis acidicola]KAA9166727.1 PH domain-containing protein [Amycolatopsis acidicola]